MTKRKEDGKTVEFVYDTEEQLTALHNEADHYYRFDWDEAGQIARDIGFYEIWVIIYLKT